MRLIENKDVRTENKCDEYSADFSTKETYLYRISVDFRDCNTYVKLNVHPRISGWFGPLGIERLDSLTCSCPN